MTGVQVPVWFPVFASLVHLEPTDYRAELILQCIESLESAGPEDIMVVPFPSVMASRWVEYVTSN